MSTILIIDHNLDNREIYRLLPSAEIELTICSTMMEAAVSLASKSPDLIISNFQLPDSNSKILARLRDLWKFKGHILLVVEDEALVSRKKASVETWADGILFTPFTLGELTSSINEALNNEMN